MYCDLDSVMLRRSVASYAKSKIRIYVVPRTQTSHGPPAVATAACYGWAAACPDGYRRSAEGRGLAAQSAAQHKLDDVAHQQLMEIQDPVSTGDDQYDSDQGGGNPCHLKTG